MKMANEKLKIKYKAQK